MSKQAPRGRRPGFKWDDSVLKRAAKTRRRKCTVDGVKIYPSVIALIAALGNGKKGYKSPTFKYVGQIDLRKNK